MLSAEAADLYTYRRPTPRRHSPRLCQGSDRASRVKTTPWILRDDGAATLAEHGSGTRELQASIAARYAE
jgi:hypothetical protein